MCAAAGIRTAGDLPVPLTPFIGRTAEVDALTRWVQDQRFVTATGPGGVGKTRLGIAVAGRFADELARTASSSSISSA
jgi:hypothetical protein